MNLIGDEGAPWEIKAIDALWRDTERPDITLQKSPELGASYDLRLAGKIVKTGDVFDVLFLPALAYYNGFETIDDIEKTVIVRGVATNAESTASITNVHLGTLQEIKFKVISFAGFNDFRKLPTKTIEDENWGAEFYDINRSGNIGRINKYIFASWNYQSVSGYQCILTQSGSDFKILFSSGFFPGTPEWVRAGNLRPPTLFTDWLTNKLSDK